MPRYTKPRPEACIAAFFMPTMIDHISQLTPDPRNARRHNPRNVGMLVSALHEVGAARSIVIDENNVILAGNATIEAAGQAGIERLRVIEADGDEIIAVRRSGLSKQAKKRLALFDNRVAELAEWDLDVLAEDKDALAGMFSDRELDYLLQSLAGDEPPDKTQAHATLAERFIVPPFSVLDARQGYWQERKRAWIALGIQSELGRGGGITFGDSPEVTEAGLNYYRNQNKDNGLLGFSEQARSHYKVDPRSFGTEATRGNGSMIEQSFKHKRHNPATQRRLDAERANNITGAPPLPNRATGNVVANMAAGTSIFDPVLCELVYRWFSPKDGAVLDPFAGGSVRGVVAVLTGRGYTGVDLSGGQLEANRAQASQITPDKSPVWVEGDSRDVQTLAAGVYDLIFSCPPYADLEVYSDDPRDLSRMDYLTFLTAYKEIISKSLAMLKPNRFACFVVGDIRDPKGLYRNFVSDTIAAFHEGGARLYNEAILVTAVGSLPIRAGRAFSSGRKLGKTHQNVLVFVKGDPKEAAKACGYVEVVDLAEQYGEVVG